MTKPKTKPKAATRSTARKTAKPASRKRSAPASSRSAAGPDTKHARIIAMLRMPTGATIAAIMTVTDWQQHSVRGFLAGVVRKKLGLNLVSEPSEKGRVYRIKDVNSPTDAPWNAMSAFANCGRAVAHVRGSYGPGTVILLFIRPPRQRWRGSCVGRLLLGARPDRAL